MTTLFIFVPLLVAFITFVVCFMCLAAGSRADDIIEDCASRRMRSVTLDEVQEIEEELKN
jgi:hypothetical protein